MWGVDRLFLVNQRVGIVRPDTEKCNPDYLFYVVSQEHFERWLYNLGKGAGQPNISSSDIASLEIPVPPIHIQTIIANILRTFDNLIENNCRRIEILEEMARAIYREWFVHFRFPGHEEVEMVDSELGTIPEGWKVKRIKDAFDILGGGTPSTKKEEYWMDGEINWYTPSDLTSSGTMFVDNSGRKITELGLQKSSAKMFPPFSVMMTSRATLGVVSINAAPACTNQGFITCIPNEHVSKHQIYFWIKDNVERIISLGTGTTYKEIIKPVFREIEFLIPPKKLKSQFDDIVNPMGEFVLNLQRQNANLSEARDLLLPKLVSGRIDVSNLDIEFPSSNKHQTSKYSDHSALDQ